MKKKEKIDKRKNLLQDLNDIHKPLKIKIQEFGKT